MFGSKEPPSKLGGIQDLEIQFELFGIMLMLDISTNHLSRYIVPYTADKIAIIPQFSTPQLLFHLRKLLKNHLSRNTFQPLHDLGRAIARWGRQKDMHMIIQYFLGINFKSIPLGNLLKNPLQPTRHSLIQDHSPIFGDPHYMIFEIVDSTSGPFETHASKNTKFSPLRGLAPFLPPASWGVSRTSFL